MLLQGGMISILATLMVVAGCTNGGGDLAMAGVDFAKCSLAEGVKCTQKAPPGTTMEKVAVTAEGDAIRVLGTLNSAAECENFASHAKTHWPDYMVQAVVNNTVVNPYGGPKLEKEVKAACSMPPPYHVSLTVAKAL